MDTSIAPLLVEGPISSSLVPVSRSHAFTFPDQPRDRIVPESLANQSSGQPGSSLGADKDNEMLAVQSRYTACVERQHLPGSTQELYRLVARLAGFASESDLNPLTREDASDAVRCIDRYVMEAASDLNAVSRDLMTMTGDAELYRLHAAIGDFAQVLCDVLKEGDTSTSLKQPWTKIVEQLDVEERSVTDWEASSGHLPRPQTPFMDSLGDRVATLVANGLTGLDVDLALFASRTYAKRNSIFHGKTYDLSKSENFAELAEWVDLNENTIERLLPNMEKPRVGMYRRLICFTRDYRICKNDDGKWVKRQAPPPEEVPHQFVPLGKSALRSSMEMGRFRPAGLDGPLPLSVSFCPAAFRRNTVAESRGTKRPAEEQPSGQPRVKAVCGLDYGKEKVKAVDNKLTDKDHFNLGELVESLHILADQLTRVSPAKARNLYAQQILQLEGELKRAGAVLDKRSKVQERLKARMARLRDKK